MKIKEKITMIGINKVTTARSITLNQNTNFNNGKKKVQKKTKYIHLTSVICSEVIFYSVVKYIYSNNVWFCNPIAYKKDVRN